jgi:hypothetical protein
MENGGKCYRCNFVQEWDIKQRNSERSEREDDDLINDLVIQPVMAGHYYDPKEKYLIYTYPGINEQELQICRTIVGVIEDYGTSYYDEVVARIVRGNRIEWHKLFGDIKHIEDTIQNLVHKGILSQEITYIGNGTKNGDIKWRYDEPLIVLDFVKDPSEVIER